MVKEMYQSRLSGLGNSLESALKILFRYYISKRSSTLPGPLQQPCEHVRLAPANNRNPALWSKDSKQINDYTCAFNIHLYILVPYHNRSDRKTVCCSWLLSKNPSFLPYETVVELATMSLFLKAPRPFVLSSLRAKRTDPVASLPLGSANYKKHVGASLQLLPIQPLNFYPSIEFQKACNDCFRSRKFVVRM